MKKLKKLFHRKSSIPLEEAKKHLSIHKLLSLGIIRKKIIKENTSRIPDDAPRWAKKFKFTRKKYNIEIIETKSVYIELTSKGKKCIKKFSKDQDEISENLPEDISNNVDDELNEEN